MAVKTSKKSAGNMVTVKQVGSPMRRDPRQALYLKSLGLGKMNRERVLIDSPGVRGLIERLKHMVQVIHKG